MFSTWANVDRRAGASAAARSSPAGGAALSQTISPIPTAATPQVHHGLGLPSWRML